MLGVTDIFHEGWQPVVLAQEVSVDLVFRDMSRPADKTRHLDAGVEHVLRPGRIALSVEAVVPHVHAVVAHEYDQRIAPQVLCFKPVQQPANMPVHPFDRGEVARKILFSRFGIDGAGVEADRQRFVRTRDRIEGAAVVVLVPQRLRMMFAAPWLVRRRVVNSEAERSFFAQLCLKEIQRVVRKQLGCVGLVLFDLTACHDGYIEIIGAAVGHGVPRVETASWFEAVAEMPLARQAGVVAAVAKQFGVCRHAEEELHAVRRHFAVEAALARVRLPHQGVVHPMLGWNPAGQD